jgi:protease-4
VLLVLLLLGSLGLNLLFVCGGLFLNGLVNTANDEPTIRERFHSGNAGAADTVAVVKIDGAIVEGLLGYAHKQIERAASDKAVKAVVVRIESPGGTITASDDLHRRLTDLRDGTTPKLEGRGTAPKPLVVSMGSMAASGGYYVAMPAVHDPQKPTDKKLFAERTTITGSIGVYLAIPNIEGLAKTHGIEMEMIKAGDVKGSGSLFHKMSPQERQPWEDMVTHAYQQFLEIVEEGRPALKGKLTEELFPPRTIPLHDDHGNVLTGEDGRPKTTTYTRKRADGGIFTADEALRYGLVDAIGPVGDAIAEAARQAGLSSYRAVTYDRPVTLLGLLAAETRAQAPAPAPDLGKLAGALGPRVWYLTPQAELAVVLQALGRQ